MAQFIHAQPGTVEHRKDHTVFDVGGRRQELLYLLHTEHLGQLMFFAWIKLRGNNERRRHYIFKEEAAGLCYLVTFFPAHTMLSNDVVDVIDNVFLRNRIRKNIRVM